MYINSDASFERSLAGIAYVSAALGNEARVVVAYCSTEAELLALRWAMDVANRNPLLVDVTFRTDAASIALPASIRAERLQPICIEICEYLYRHEGWRIHAIPRGQNVQANILARRALRTMQPKPKT